MELHMWIVVAVLSMLLIITFVKLLAKKENAQRAEIKATMAEKRETQLKAEVVALRNQVKRLEADRMFTRSTS